jgi:hypothetical protein
MKVANFTVTNLSNLIKELEQQLNPNLHFNQAESARLSLTQDLPLNQDLEMIDQN